MNPNPLPPGRELDAKVHETITGQQVAMTAADVHRLHKDGADFAVLWNVPAYSTDLGAAMEALVGVATGEVVFTLHVHDACFVASWWNAVDDSRGDCRVLPSDCGGDPGAALALAICRAVVAWRGGEA